jgi:hypothetical protein
MSNKERERKGFINDHVPKLCMILVSFFNSQLNSSLLTYFTIGMV